MNKVYKYRMGMARILLWASPMILVTLVLYETPLFMAMIMAMNLMFVVIGYKFSTIIIGSTGIQLYHVNKMTFNDIRCIERKRYFGLPYIKVTRIKGMSWYVPLYFYGEVPIKDALLLSVPKELKIYEEIKSI